MLEHIRFEVVARLGKRLGAAQMFRDDTGTCARGTKGLELKDGANKCRTTRLAKQAKVAGVEYHRRSVRTHVYWVVVQYLSYLS